MIIINTDVNTSDEAIYLLVGDGIYCIARPANNAASWKFSDFINSTLYHDENTISSVNPENNAVKVTITGCASDGYTLSSEFTKYYEKFFIHP